MHDGVTTVGGSYGQSILGSTGHDGARGIRTSIADGTVDEVDAIKKVHNWSVRVCVTSACVRRVRVC